MNPRFPERSRWMWGLSLKQEIRLSDRYKDCELDFGHEFDISRIVFGAPLYGEAEKPSRKNGCRSHLDIQKLTDCMGTESSTRVEHETRREQRQDWTSGLAEEKAAEETGKVIRAGKKPESC